jgi:hypothetical protein
MKSLKKSILGAFFFAAPAAFAASGSDSEGSSFLLWFFLGFGALIIVFQSIPGLILLFSMIKGVFSPADKKATEKSNHS